MISYSPLSNEIVRSTSCVCEIARVMKSVETKAKVEIRVSISVNTYNMMHSSVDWSFHFVVQRNVIMRMKVYDCTDGTYLADIA